MTEVLQESNTRSWQTILPLGVINRSIPINHTLYMYECNSYTHLTAVRHMKEPKKYIEKKLNTVGPDYFNRLWEESWTHIKTVVDVMREPVVILDKNLCVLAANEPFYKTFQVDPKETENINIYKLGNGQWNIPTLRKLLEEILPKNTFFKGYEVAHDFPYIGRKVMILNARQIHFKEDTRFEPIILLAMEDATSMIAVADTFASHADMIEKKLLERTIKLETHMEKLEMLLRDLKSEKAV